MDECNHLRCNITIATSDGVVVTVVTGEITVGSHWREKEIYWEISPQKKIDDLLVCGYSTV